MNKQYNAFLGGECGGNTWRKSVVPALEAAGVTAFDPVVDDWTAEFEANVERPAKQGANTLVFGFFGETRAIASMVEVGFAVASGRDVIVLDGGDMVDGTQIKGQTITGRELQDINRGKYYMRQQCEELGVKVVHTPQELVDELISRYGN